MPPHQKKLLNPLLDYNTVLRLQIFVEILDSYWFFMLRKIHNTHAEWNASSFCVYNFFL